MADIGLCVAVSPCALEGGRDWPTYISPFSKRFFRLSLIASLEILLISVRSDTPTSFFLVLSKTAFLNCGRPPLLPPVRLASGAASFLRPALLVTPCRARESDLERVQMVRLAGRALLPC